MSAVFKDFHQLSQSLLLWLASAESRRQKAHVADPEADPQVLLACQEELVVSFLLRDPALPLACAGPQDRVASPGISGNCPLVFHPHVPVGIPPPKWDERKGEAPWSRAGSLNHCRTGAIGV